MIYVVIVHTSCTHRSMALIVANKTEGNGAIKCTKAIKVKCGRVINHIPVKFIIYQI